MFSLLHAPILLEGKDKDSSYIPSFPISDSAIRALSLYWNKLTQQDKNDLSEMRLYDYVKLGTLDVRKIYDKVLYQYVPDILTLYRQADPSTYKITSNILREYTESVIEGTDNKYWKDLFDNTTMKGLYWMSETDYSYYNIDIDFLSLLEYFLSKYKDAMNDILIVSFPDASSVIFWDLIRHKERYL